MTTVQLEQLPKNSLKIRVTVPHDDVVPFLEEAANRISEETTIEGFRPGKAGFEVEEKLVNSSEAGGNERHTIFLGVNRP